MKLLLQKIKMILENRRFRRIWYRTVGLVSAIMVFITTYAMVLPAITLDVSTARVEPGIAFEQVQYRTPASNVTVAAAENSSEETAVETAAEEVQAEEPEQEEPQAPAEEAAPEESEASEEETSAEAAPVEEDTQTETPGGDTQEEAAPEETEASEEETSAEAAPVEEEPQTEAAPADQPGTTEEAAAAATEQAAQFQIPELSELDFDEILTNRTGFYFYHNENVDTEGSVSSDAVDEWKKADADTVLAPADFVRVYLPYEIPAGALNETNQTASFRLPGNLHITDKQVRAINKFENGIYKNTGDSKYLGAEAIEGTRTPDEKLRDGEEEYISALVKVENLSNGGQNLVFTFTPYTIGKNQTAYDQNGQVTAEGQKVKGWFTVDFTVDQIDWNVVDESTETVEAAESGDGSGTEAKTVTTTTKSAEIVFTDDIRATLTLEEKEETAAEAAAETDEGKKAEAEEKAAAVMPAQNFEETVTVKTGKVSDEQTTDAAEALPGKDKLTVRVEAEEGTFPEGTTMKVTPIKGSKLEEVGAAAADAVDGTACGYQAVDISFINADGKEIEPAKAIRVTMTSDSIAKAAEAEKISASPAIVHVADDGNAEANKNIIADPASDSKDAAADSVVFEADQFSTYVIVYTVDFEYSVNGKMFQFSLPGGEKIALSDVVEVLGILDGANFEDVEAFLAEVADVEFSDPELVKVTKNEEGDDWLLESLAPFSTEESLIISLRNGEVIEVKVTDATTYTNLSDFITDARLTVDGKTYGKGDTWTVRPEVDYDLKLYFSEAGQRQFPNGGDEMVMDLVPGMTLSPGTSGTFDIPFGDAGTLGGNRWFVGDDNKLHIVFADDPDDLLTRSSKTRFEVDLFASFDGSQNEIVFNDRVKRDVVINNDTDASIEKKGNYNPDTGKMEYTLTVKSEGKSQDVKVTDIISGDMLTLDQNSITIEPQKQLKGGINKNSKGFDLTISEMSHNETVTIKYEAFVDHSKIGPGGTVTGEDGKNTVKVETNNKEHEDEEIVNTIKFSDVSKFGTTQVDNGDTVEMGWKIEANKGMRGSIKGSKITDKIDYNNKDNMHYLVGEDGKLALSVTKTNANGQSTSETVYVDVTKEYNGAPETWTWIPQDEGIYSYEITYKTVVTKQASTLTVKNDVTNESDSTDSGTGVVPGTGPDGPGPGSNIVGAKKAVNVTPEYIDWDIAVIVPAEGYPDGFVIVDEVPNGADLGRKFADTFDRIISVSGLHDNESYDEEPEVTYEEHNNLSPKKKEIVTINFYQDKAKTDPGLDGGSQRTLTVRIRTLNDPDWVNFADTANGGELAIYHTNKAKANNSNWFTDRAAPMHTSIEKSKRDLNADTVDGVKLQKYEYSLTLTNVTKLPIVITDTYNENELVFIGPGDSSAQHHTIAAETQKNNLNNGVPGYEATYDASEPGTLTITVDNLPTKPDGSFYEFYRIYYTMRIKDADALTAIRQQALLNDGVYNVTNTVEWEGAKDEYDIEFKVPVVEKEGAFLGELGTSKERQYRFTIKVNSDRSELNGGEPMELTDTHSENLSVDYHSVKVYKLPAGVDTVSEEYLDNSVKWNFDGNNGVFNLEDGTYYVITYDALIIGSGSQNFWNEAEMNGFTATKKDSRNFGGSASGEGIIYQIKLIKHKDGQTSEGLGGAKFQLFKDDGNGGKEPMKWGKDSSLGKAGENITFTTDDTGYVLIAFNQSQHGNELEGNVHYYLKEIETPAGYELRDDSPEYWEFTLTKDPDEVNYGDPDRLDANGRRQWIYYYYNDVLKMANVPAEEPITVNVNKLWFDEEGKPIKTEDLNDLVAKIRLQRKTNNGEYENVKVTYDSDGNPTVETATGNEGIVELNKDNEWKWSWPDLPRVTNDGTKYAYKIEEVSLEGYVVSITEKETETTKTYALKNYKVPPEDQTTKISVKKVWQNESGAIVQAPENKIKFHLYQVMSKVPFEVQPTSGGSLYDAAGQNAHKVPQSEWEDPSEDGTGYYQLGAGDNWTLTFDNLPSAVVDRNTGDVTYYAYYVKEDAINSYTTSYSTEFSDDGIVNQITNMPEGSYMNLSLEKKWKKGEELITPPAGGSATFDIHRMKSKCTVLPMTHPVTVRWGENSLTADVGDELVIYTQKDPSKNPWDGANINWPADGSPGWTTTAGTYNVTIPANYSGNEFVITSSNNSVISISNVIDKTGRKKEMAEAVDDGIVKTVTLSDTNSWREYVKDLIRVDQDGNVYSYYAVETSCTPEAVEVVYTDDIGKDAEHAVGANADIEVTNKVINTKGALKFKKAVEVGGAGTENLNDADKALANGEFTFTITGPGNETNVNKTVVIKVENGVATQYSLDSGEFNDLPADKYVVIPDLDEGDYTITETATGNMVLKDIVRGDGDNGAVSKADSKVVVHVTGGDESPVDTSAAAAAFTNNRELTNFEFTKEWHKQDDQIEENWQEGVAITVKVERKVTSSPEMIGTYTITKTSNGFTITPSEGAPNLVNKDDTFTFQIVDLPKRGKIGNDIGEYTYYATEPTAVANYKDATYSNPSSTNPNVWITSEEYAISGGKIINRPVEAYELPSTGGPGTRLFTILGSILILGAGVLMWRRRRTI